MSDYLSRSARKRPRDDYEEFSRGPKRGRYSDPGPRSRESESSEQSLESLIARLGEKSHKGLENNLEMLSGLLINDFKDKILHIICKCVVSMTEKRSIYSTLVGLLNAKKYDIGEQMLDLVVAELRNALALGLYEKVRHLVCFLADLVNCRVVSVNSIVSLFDTLVTVTFEPDIPQVRSDCYVYMVLSALSAVGAELEERKRQELERLLITIDNYMSKRATPFLPMFRVWTSDQPHPQRDYLELLWVQVKAQRKAEWKSQVLMNLHTSFQSELGGAYLHSLPNIQVPNHTPGSSYPLPYAVFRLFSAEDVQYPPSSTTSLPAPESVDRFLAENTVKCILASHESNRKECTSALMRFSETARERLGLSADYVIAEVLFGYIMQLPHPPQVLIYYSSVLIELCKNNPTVFPQLLSQTTELLFSRLDSMNTIAIDRFAIWFSHHLSNFKYQWDWNKWCHVTQGPPDHPSVKFITEVFVRCIRLACYEEFVEMIPKELTSLLPAEPAPVFKYSAENGSTGPEVELAAQLLEAIKKKEPMENLQAVLDSLSDVGTGYQTLSETKMAVLTQCVLRVGCKTITHCFLALVKFRPLFIELANEENCKNICLKALAEFYTNNTQLHGLVIDKLLRMSVVDPLSVINWLFSSELAPRFATRFVWEVLESTIKKARNNHLTAKSELRETKDKLKTVSELDEVAMGSGEREELEGRVEELEDKVDEGGRLLRDLFLAVFERLVDSLGSQLDQGDTLWIRCTMDNCRQLLVKNCAEVARMASLLEDVVFTSDIHPRLLDMLQQFQALL